MGKLGQSGKLGYSFHIEKPCNHKLDEAEGEKDKFCGKCQKFIPDLDALSDEELLLLLRNKKGTCGTLSRGRSGMKAAAIASTIAMLTVSCTKIPPPSPQPDKDGNNKEEDAPWFHLKGQLLDQQRKPLEGRALFIKDEQGVKSKCRTGKDGGFTFHHRGKGVQISAGEHDDGIHIDTMKKETSLDLHINEDDQISISSHAMLGGVSAVMIIAKGESTVYEPIEPLRDTIEPVTGEPFQKEITLFPNPATDWFNYKANFEMQKIEIFNMNGSLLRTIDQPDTRNLIHIEELASGTYMLRFYHADGELETKKLIVQ